MPRLLEILSLLTSQHGHIQHHHALSDMSLDANTVREDAPPPIDIHGEDVTLLPRSQWSDMRATWSAMQEDTKMDVDDSSSERCTDNFVCVDGHDDVLLRFWFPIAPGFASHTSNLVMQYRARDESTAG